MMNQWIRYGVCFLTQRFRHMGRVNKVPMRCTGHYWAVVQGVSRCAGQLIANRADSAAQRSTALCCAVAQAAVMPMPVLMP
jgi:hypothetical protein